MTSLLHASKPLDTASDSWVSKAGIVWALDEAQCKPSLRLTLVVIARAADEDGRSSWQSAATIAEKTGKSVRQVKRDTAELLAAGLILAGDQSVVAHLPAGRRPMVYDLPLATGSPTPSQDSGLTPTSPELSTGMTPKEAERCHQCAGAGVVNVTQTILEKEIKNSLSPTSVANAPVRPEKKSFNLGKQWLKKLVSIPDRALAQLGIPAPDRPGIIAHITEKHSVRSDGWWITATNNGSLVQRVHDTLEALKPQPPALDLSKYPPCEHDLAGGDVIRPKFGTPTCSQCRFAFLAKQEREQKRNDALGNGGFAMPKLAQCLA